MVKGRERRGGIASIVLVGVVGVAVVVAGGCVVRIGRW